MSPIDYFLPRGQVLQWHGQAGQCLQVCSGLILLEELLWVEEQLLQPRQRLGPGSCYVLHSRGWVTLTALGDAQLRLPAGLPATAPGEGVGHRAGAALAPGSGKAGRAAAGAFRHEKGCQPSVARAARQQRWAAFLPAAA